MRIIAGEFKGRTIKAPKGDGTRPTTDRVRESLMSSVASARGGFEGAVVLDVFAGSGALGLEALSRGATCARFFERDAAAVHVLEGNVRALKLDTQRARVSRTDVLKNPPLHSQPLFDLVFLDPPYAFAAQDVLGLVAALKDGEALAPDALVVYEHSASNNNETDAAATACGLSLASRKKYGDTAVDLLTFKELNLL